jgi:hypothetical protein
MAVKGSYAKHLGFFIGRIARPMKRFFIRLRRINPAGNSVPSLFSVV